MRAWPWLETPISHTKGHCTGWWQQQTTTQCGLIQFGTSEQKEEWRLGAIRDASAALEERWAGGGGGVYPHIKSYLNKRWQILWITSTSYFTLNRFSHDKQLFLKLPSFPLSHHQKAFHTYISEHSTSPLEGIVWHFGKYTYSPKCQTLPVNASFKADTFPTPSI